MRKSTFFAFFATLAFLLMSQAASGQRVKISSLSDPFPTLTPQEIAKHKTSNPRAEKSFTSRSLKASQSGATILGWHTYPEPTFWAELKTSGVEVNLWQNEELSPDAGFVSGDKVYFYYAKNVSGYLSMRYYVCQLSDGKILESGDLSTADATQYVFMCAYDDVNDVVYAYTYNADASAFLLQKIKPNTRTFTKICEVTRENFPSMIGYDTVDGKLYGITRTGDFVNINLTNGAFTVVKSTGFSPSAYKQAMTYSPVDKKFIWAALLSDMSSCVISIDPATGVATKTASLPAYTEYKVLAPKDKTPKGSTPAAPVIKSINFPKANLSGSVTVTAPNKYYDDSDLTGNVTITSTLDGAKHSTQTVAAGSDVNVEFNNLTEGNHTFSFTATDSYNNSSTNVYQTAFIGNDKPLAPSNVTLDGNGVKWDAVTIGVNGGYVDAEATTYNVYVNGEKVNQAPVSDTKYAYTFPKGAAKAYVAEVEAIFNGNISEKARSPKFIYGDPYSLPANITFNAEVVDLCTIVDANNDNFHWAYDSGKAAMYYSYGGNTADDWLFLPKTAFTNAESMYEVAVSAFTRMSYYNEAFEIAYGTSPDPSSMTVVAKYSPVNNTAAQDYMAYFKVPAAGNYYVGIHCTSPANQDNLYVDKVTIKASERSANCPEKVTNLSAKAATMGELKAYVNFTMPTKNIAGENLASDTKLTAVVTTGDQSVRVVATPGQDVADVAITTVQGTNEISVAVVSGDDTSSAATTSVFTGYSIPGSVGTIKVELSDDNLTANLSWSAPSWATTTDGYYDKESLVYYYCTYQGGKWVEQKALGAATQCSVSVPAGTKMAVQYAGIKAENKGGKSPYTSYATITIGSPYTLPMSDSFKTGNYDYSPVITVAPNSSYSGKHALAAAKNYGVTDAEDGQYAMVMYSTNSYAESYCLVALPKFSTVGVKKPRMSIRVWGGSNLANSEIHVVAPGIEETKVAEFWNNLSAEWHDIEFDIPTAFCDKKWVEVRIMSTFYPSEEKYTIIDSYKIYDGESSGIADVSTNANVTVIPGIESVVVSSPVATQVDIYTTDGALVCKRHIAEGETTIEIPAGIYVVRASGSAQKIVVK